MALLQPPCCAPPLSGQVANSARSGISSSALANMLQEMRATQNVHPDRVADSVCHDIVDSMLRTSHAKSQLHLPSAADILRTLCVEDRRKTVLWLLEVCML